MMLTIGIIGTGGRSVPYTVLPPDVRQDVRVSALSRRDEVKLREYAESYFDRDNMPKLYTDYHDLLDDGDLDAVVICTPDNTHKDIAIAALRKGKHVLLEKPFATTFADCKELYGECVKQDRVIRLGFILRYTGLYQKIKKIVDSGALGKLVTVQAKETLSHVHAGSYFRRWNRFKQASGGFLNAKCSHDMDMMNWLIGSEPVYVSAFGGRSFFIPKEGAADRCRNCAIQGDCTFNYYAFQKRYGDFNTYEDLCVFNVEKDLVDHQVVNVEYENNVTLSYTVSMLSAEPGRTLHIFGTDATLYASMSHEDASKNFIEVKSIHPKSEEIHRFESIDNTHDRIICESFIDSIRSGDYSDKSDARAGLLSSGVALAADMSMEERRVVNLRELIKTNG